MEGVVVGVEGRHFGRYAAVGTSCGDRGQAGGREGSACLIWAMRGKRRWAGIREKVGGWEWDAKMGGRKQEYGGKQNRMGRKCMDRIGKDLQRSPCNGEKLCERIVRVAEGCQRTRRPSSR